MVDQQTLRKKEQKTEIRACELDGPYFELVGSKMTVPGLKATHTKKNKKKTWHRASLVPEWRVATERQALYFQVFPDCPWLPSSRST